MCRTKVGSYRFGLSMLAAVVCTAAWASPAQAPICGDIAITSVTLNGESSVVVTPGDTITVVVTTSGSGWWKSTRWAVNGEGDCVDPDGGDRHIGPHTFDIAAPGTPGTYSITIKIYRRDDCDLDDECDDLTLTDAIVVAYIGACCLPDYSCAEMTAANCQSAGGDYQGDDTQCADIDCFPDCNGNGIPDETDIAGGTSQDCQPNQIPDECDIADGSSEDCNENGVPDECELVENDCNQNSVPDECDIDLGTSDDCNYNGTPDECEPDCNDNGLADSCDIASGTSEDCQVNQIPDECDIADGSSLDCQLNGIPDECEIGENDCNQNGIPDECDITDGSSLDCQPNEIPDECESDSDGDGVIDECDGCPNSANRTSPPCDGGGGGGDNDRDDDGVVDSSDNCPDTPNGPELGTCLAGLIDETCNSDSDCDDEESGASGDCSMNQEDLDDDGLGDVCDSDWDGDGIDNDTDGCPRDGNKKDPGACGCGNADTDVDGDGTADCIDECPDDPNKVLAGDCGCDLADDDGDGDGTADCDDDCPNDPNKTSEGVCGCGVADVDSDGDGAEDCNDDCPNDADNDTDGDGVCGDVDNCPLDPNPNQEDTDEDGIGDACEQPGPQAEPQEQPPAPKEQLLPAADICGCCGLGSQPALAAILMGLMLLKFGMRRRR